MFFIETDLDLLETLRQNSLKELNNSPNVLNKISVIVKRDSEASFPNQKSPEGKPWEPSKTAEEENRLTLVDTGELSENLIFKNTGNDIEVMASDLSEEYGFKHQFGGLSRLPNGEDIILPPRPFAGLTEQGKKEVEQIIINSFFN